MQEKAPSMSSLANSSTQVHKWIYFLYEKIEADDAPGLVGGKGVGLAQMLQADLPVPPGFTITTQAWKAYKREDKLPEAIWDQIVAALAELEQLTGKQFGGTPSPLLVSVRSGARVSMPGIMDTVLNVGLNDQTVKALAELTDSRRFAHDVYRRLIQMFGRAVRNIRDAKFERILDSFKTKTGVERDSDLTAEALQKLVREFKKVYKRESGERFPQDPHRQLRLAIEAVFASWDSQHAQVYREQHDIPADWGTAVTVQSMVFGNIGSDSGTGVVFTRHPATGVKGLFGEYLLNAQGEDVVRGIRSPESIDSMKHEFPNGYRQLEKLAAQLDRHYCDMQDLEFTIEQGKLWLLQTRSGKRTAPAALRIAVDLVNGDLLGKKEAVLRIEPSQFDKLMLSGFDPTAKALARDWGRYLTQGLGASPGVVAGQAVLDASRVEKFSKKGAVILVQPDVTLADVLGNVEAISGILTQKGGVTSHPMVVARAWGLACVTGCKALEMDVNRRQFTIGSHKLQEGEILSLDGTTGEVFLGEIPISDGGITGNKDASTLLEWADEFADIEVWANADQPWEIERARSLGAKGIGLCRTERMFSAEDRFNTTRKVLLAVVESAEHQGEDYQEAVNELVEKQRDGFKELFRAAQGLPIVIRLLDAPIQDLLPDHPELEEVNPSIGLRGVRLSVLFPEVSRIQARAMFEAASESNREGKTKVDLRIAIPLVSYAKEFEHAQDILVQEAEAVMKELDTEVSYRCGVLIQTPRAAFIAGRLAEFADFLTFDTDRLTQATLHCSRQDFEITSVAKYLQEDIMPSNPYAKLDEAGVGRLMSLAADDGRRVRPDLEFGICGFHAGGPESMPFYQELELTYVSCPRSRILAARIASAQAQLRTPH
jgi:pyruvate,orthophosphate dikinase